ncbi:MAG: GNAT family N-acetyltransferase [Planctomycetales bacterium]|nr:GNAT family N-acetyltransferase [Planctomycetales bacterium]
MHSSITFLLADLHDERQSGDVVALLDHYAAHPMGQGRRLSPDVKARLLPGLRSRPNALAVLAYLDGSPVGLALCFEGFSSFQAMPLVNIHDFVVHESVRGQGVGRALMQHVFALARERGCCRVTLEVQVDNRPAMRLYESCGFEPGDPESTAHWFWKKELG